MGYRIEYDGEVVVWKRESHHGNRILLYSGMFFVLFLIMTHLFWPEGWVQLENWIYPGDAAVTKEALQNMASELRTGMYLSDAVTAFCREIIHGSPNMG